MKRSTEYKRKRYKQIKMKGDREKQKNARLRSKSKQERMEKRAPKRSIVFGMAEFAVECFQCGEVQSESKYYYSHYILNRIGMVYFAFEIKCDFNNLEVNSRNTMGVDSEKKMRERKRRRERK